jgi:hypothetical protein
VNFKDIFEDDHNNQNIEAGKSSAVGSGSGLEYKLIKSLGAAPGATLDDNTAGNLLTTAHDQAEEVETVCFGLQQDDGEIVKVYVNVDQSEAFEAALADALGKKDDIEEVINDLADEYDIVSVEWPGEREGEQNAPEDTNPDSEQDGGAEDDNDNKEYQLDFDLSNKVKSDEDDKKKPEKAKQEDDNETSEDKPEDDSDEDFGGLELGDDTDKEEDEDTDKEEEDSEEEDSDKDEEDDTDEDETNPDKPKKKKKPKKSKDTDKELDVKESFIFSHFLNKEITIINEQRDKDVFSKKELKIEDIFNSAFQQNIVKLLFLLDFPVERMLSRKAVVRKSIRARALELNTHSKIKLMISRLIRELETLSTKDEYYDKQRKLVSDFKEEDLKESDVEEKLTSDIQRLLLDVYKHLGIPDQILKSKVGVLRQEIRKTAKVFVSHPGLKSKLVKLPKEEVIKEEDGQFSSDPYTNLVVAVMEGLGLPTEIIDLKPLIIKQSIKERKTSLNLAQIKPRLIQLYKLLGGQELTNEELTFEESTNMYMHRASNLGDWSISNVKENGIMLSIEDISISIEGKAFDLFKQSIENGFSTFVRDGNDEWEFKAIEHGKRYIVINEASDKYMNGILMSEDDIDNILELLKKD